MLRSPNTMLERLTRTIRAWETVCPDTTFSGQTLAQFKETVKASFETRAELEAVDNQREAIIARRDAADVISNEAWKRNVHGVKAEPTQGADGAMYGAMGFVRESQRGTGLTRRNKKNGTDEVKANGGS